MGMAKPYTVIGAWQYHSSYDTIVFYTALQHAAVAGNARVVLKLLKDAIIHAGRTARGTGRRRGIYEKADLSFRFGSF